MSDPLVLPATQTRCRLELEGWDSALARAILADPRPNSLRHGFFALAELLAEIVDDPSEVTLVIPVDLSEAVRSREPDVPYSAERGSGIVGARVMSRPFGGVDVIVRGDPIGMLDGPNLPVLNSDPEAIRIVRRSVIHEAQHVIMAQRKSGFDEYDVSSIEGLFSREMVRCAAKLCDEHRAEWHAIARTQPEPPAVSDVAHVLQALGREIAAANFAYQAAPGATEAVYILAVAVLTACSHFWTSLGYWLAQHRTGDNHIGVIPADIEGMPLWQRYGGEVWALLQNSLVTLPVEDLTTAPGTLTFASVKVAASLTASLNQIGFRFEETAAGPAFYINRPDFPQQ